MFDAKCLMCLCMCKNLKERLTFKSIYFGNHTQKWSEVHLANVEIYTNETEQKN